MGIVIEWQRLSINVRLHIKLHGKLVNCNDIEMLSQFLSLYDIVPLDLPPVTSGAEPSAPPKPQP